MPALTEERRIKALTKDWPKADLGPAPKALPPPNVETIRTTTCKNCGKPQIPFVRITTHVEGSTPLEVPSCDRCGY